MDKSLEELAKKRELLARAKDGAASAAADGKQEGEMSEEMAAFIARKREAEQAPAADAASTSPGGGKDEKARRREEILRKIQERRAAKQAAKSGGDAASSSAASPSSPTSSVSSSSSSPTSAETETEAKAASVLEDRKRKREAEAEKRGAEAAKKEFDAELERQLAEALAAHKAEKESLLSKHKEEMDGLRAQQSSADAAAKRISELEAQLEAAAASQSEAIAAAKAQSEAIAEERVAAEKESLEVAHKEALEKATSELESTREALEEKKKETAELQETIADLEELMSSNDEAEAATAKLLEAESTHAAKTLEWEARVQEESSRAASLAEESETLKEKLSTLESTHAEKLSALEKALEAEKAARALDAEEALTREAEAMTSESSKETSLAEELEKERKRVEELSKENEELIDTLAEMQATTNTRLAEIEEALTSEKSEREKLREQLDTKDLNASEALQAIEERKAAAEAEIALLKEEKAALEASASVTSSAGERGNTEEEASTPSGVAKEVAVVADKTEAEKKEAMARASQSSLSGFVPQLLEEINKLRSSPAAYGDSLKEHLENYDGVTFTVPGESYTLETKEGAKGLEDAIAALASTSPLPTLTLAAGLSASCQDLCDSNGPVGLVSDTSTDGTTAEARLVRHGRWSGKVNELMSYGPRSNVPKDVVRQWLVDDGNFSKQQRGTLLDASFKVIGIAHGDHAEFDQMAVVAVAQGYTVGDDAAAGVISREKTELRESNDGTCFVITSQPCRVQKENVKVLMKGKTLAVVTKRHDGESVKTFTHQWNLPFAVPVCNVSAKYTDATEVEIVIKKKASDVVGGAQSIKKYTLPVAEVPNNRLRVDVKQQPHAILFTTEPCSCEVTVDLKIVDGTTLCFESVYTEISDKANSKETKTITRKETVSLPFSITADRLSFTRTDAEGLTVSLLKPSVDTASEISIPLE